MEISKIITYLCIKLKQLKNMEKVLAIRGHYQRGNEVIKILEMLGGINTQNLHGLEMRNFYYICPHTNIIKFVFEEYMIITQWETHSLDSFNKDFPYKTFDKLVINGKDCSIVETYWNGFTICYKVDYGFYLSEYTAERIQEFFVEKPMEQEVVKTDCEGKTTTISPLEIYGNTYEGLEYLEKMGYSLDSMTCGELKKLLYHKIVG